MLWLLMAALLVWYVLASILSGSGCLVSLFRLAVYVCAGLIVGGLVGYFR